MTDKALDTRDIAWLTSALALALLPHLLRFPPLLSLGFAVAALWRVLGAVGRVPLPDRAHRVLWVLKQLVAIMAFLAIYIAYHGKFGRDAGVQLLGALLGLKLLEMYSARDYYVVLFLCYFLVVTNFFYSQTVLTAVYMLGVVVLVNAVLLQFHTPASLRRSADLLRQAGLMTAQCVPLMVLTFVLFPRVPGPLWGMPQDALDATTGLSDTMSIGDITRLGLSNEIAFRVEFEGAEPRAKDRYWRGPVLWLTDGRNWRGGPMSEGAPGAVDAQGTRFRYSITIEPQRQRWLPGLDVVTMADAGMQRTADYAVLAAQAPRKRLRYTLTSAIDYRLTGLTSAQRDAALTLPPGRHKRARALAAQWRAENSSLDALTQRALAYFHDERFYYSLTPPALPNDSVDEFLFDTREGFCEHFAASFVVLMRAAGVPARVVTGYQGGEYNDLGQYLVVRQRDAHAWAEVYDDARGWLRVDPTAAVAPERVSLGFAEARPRGVEDAGFGRDGFSARWLSQLRDGVDALTYGWNRWVLGYTQKQQQRLLENVGFDDLDYGSLTIALTVMLAAATGLLGSVLLRVRRGRPDPVQAAYARFCARLGRLGYARAASEAPLAYARRVGLARPDLAADVYGITRLYAQTRYGRGALDTGALTRAVARFRPRKR